MKISIIGPRAYPSDFIGTSGLEVYIENVTRELLKLDKKIALNIYTRKKYQGVSKKNNSRLKTIPILTIYSKIFETFSYSLAASLLVLFDGSDIVWIHGVGSAFFSFLPRLFGKKVFVTVHGIDWQRKKWNFIEKFLFGLLANLVFKYNAHYFVVSKSLHKHLKRSFNVNSHYLPPGIELYSQSVISKNVKRFGLRPRNYILYLGRVVPEKRLELLLGSFLKLKNKFGNVKLVIAGGHGNLPRYETKLKNKYTDKDVEWVGYVFGNEKISLIRNCRCLVLPSELEGNPVSVVEALGMSVWCLVSSNVKNEMPKLKNILSFKVGDNRSFERGFNNILLKGKRKYNYSFRELKQIQKFTWNNNAQRSLNYFWTSIVRGGW